MLVDELVDGRLIHRFHLFELEPHADAAVAPGDAALRFDVALEPGSRKRARAFVPLWSGLIVRMASPPLLRFRVSAAAMVLPKR